MTADLRRLAAAATPGPWWHDEFLAVMPGLPVTDGPMPPEIALVSPFRGPRETQDADAAYIAAASPDVVTALLDRLDALGSALGEALRAYDADVEASAGRGHDGPHDIEFHSIHHSPPCTWDEDCAACASAQYGCDAELQSTVAAARSLLEVP